MICSRRSELDDGGLLSAALVFVFSQYHIWRVSALVCKQCCIIIVAFMWRNETQA